MVTEAMVKEGHGPHQVSADEVIRYLWRKKEDVAGELKAATQTLRKTVGGEQYRAIQVGMFKSCPDRRGS